MGVTVYSFGISVFFFNLALILVFIMRRSGVFLARRAFSFLMLTAFLGLLRLLTPLDFDRAFVLRSYRLIPAVEAFLDRPVAGGLRVGSLLLWLWFGGTLVSLLRYAVLQLRFVRASRRFPLSDRRDLLELAAEFGDDFGLVSSPWISRPYAAGLFHPTVYLPDIALPEEQWRLILRHEVQHIRSRDEWKKLCFLAVQALFWWNPLAHISRRELDTLIELQCDAQVTAAMSAEEVDAYLETLKTLLTHAKGRRLALASSPLVWDDAQMVTRFQALDRSRPVGGKGLPIAAYVLTALVFITSYCVIVQPYYEPREGQLLAFRDGQISSLTQPEAPDSDEIVIVERDGEKVMYINGDYFFIIDDAVFSDPELSEIPLFDFPITGGD